MSFLTHKNNMVGNMIDPTIQTDDKPNYSYYNEYKAQIEKIKVLIKTGAEVVFYPHFVTVNGVDYNIEPALVKALI